MNEAYRGAGAQACDCKLDRLWFNLEAISISRLRIQIFNMYFPLFHPDNENLAKRGVEFHEMPPEFGGKWKCLN